VRPRSLHADGIASVVHGGDLAAIARRYGVDAGDLVDFSANINPLGPPPSLVRELTSAAADLADLGCYPEPDAATLRTALGTHLGVDPEAIVVGNGAAALLEIALAAVEVRRCLVPVPAFSEDRRAIEARGAEFVPFALRARDDFAMRAADTIDAVRSGDADTCLVTNPHNPSGSLTPRSEILSLCDALRAAGKNAIVDEAFIDYVPEASVTAYAAEHSRVIVVRSLTKFFAVPALRVGYAVCQPAVARRMRSYMASWPITTIAARAIAAALGDYAYAQRTRSANTRERTRLQALLEELGLRVLPSSANFLLFEIPRTIPNTAALVEILVRRSRLVVRDCCSYEGPEAARFIRVAVLDPQTNDRLVAALAQILGPAIPRISN
jgi:threonine-phosphate decarboxylase